MPDFWPFYRSSSSSAEASRAITEAEIGAAESLKSAAWNANPPLIICEGFLSAAQSVVWGNEFRTYLGVGHQQLVDHFEQLGASHVGPSKRRSALGSDRPVVFAPIGPVSSLHDRACELFYALRGGTVDYGEQHALQHGHSRYGRHYDQPLCPSWGPSARRSEKKSSGNGKPGLPAHFIGHSLGGPTILRLQQLLRQGFFDEALGYTRHDEKHSQRKSWCPEDLVLSITSVSSPFRGTPIVYSLGSEPVPYPKVRWMSFGDVLAKFVHIAAYLDLPFFDPHADAWHFSSRRNKSIQHKSRSSNDLEESANAEASVEAKKEAQTGVRELLKQLWKSDWAEGRDCAPWECTFAERELDRWEDGWGLEHSHAKTRTGKTWYRSYAGGMTLLDPSTGPGGPAFHRPETYWSLSPLTFTSHLIGRFDYSKLSPLPSFVTSGSLQDLSPIWWENDGIVPLASQFHPLDCDRARCVHFHGMPASLPFGKRRKRPQSRDFAPGQMGTLSTLSSTDVSGVSTPISAEPGTPVDSEPNIHVSKTQDSNPELLPLPVMSSSSSRSIAGSARSAAKIAYFTSMRALNAHDPPLLTPSEEELISFLPQYEPSATDRPRSQPNPGVQPVSAQGHALKDLTQPSPNLWYTFQLPNIDHTSLCPFWTGSELQKQFWTGMGYFLASVDRQANYQILG